MVKIPVLLEQERSLRFQVKNIKLQQSLYKVHQVQCKEVRKKGRYGTDRSAWQTPLSVLSAAEGTRAEQEVLQQCRSGYPQTLKSPPHNQRFKND